MGKSGRKLLYINHFAFDTTIVTVIRGGVVNRTYGIHKKNYQVYIRKKEQGREGRQTNTDGAGMELGCSLGFKDRT